MLGDNLETIALGNPVGIDYRRVRSVEDGTQLLGATPSNDVDSN